MGLTQLHLDDDSSIQNQVDGENANPMSNLGGTPLHHAAQKYSRLRCLLRVKGLVIGFYLGWSGHTLLIRKI